MRPQLNAALSGGAEAPPPPQPGKAGEEGEAAAGPLALMRRLPARERALCEWVVDVMAVVVAREAHNRMGVDAIAVVIAPNLLRPPDTPDPAAMLGFTQQSVKFVETLLAEHLGEGAPAEGAAADAGEGGAPAPGGGEAYADERAQAERAVQFLQERVAKAAQQGQTELLAKLREHLDYVRGLHAGLELSEPQHHAQCAAQIRDFVKSLAMAHEDGVAPQPVL